MLKVGDPVVLQPSNITTEVGSIEMYHTPRQVALPGDLVAFKYADCLCFFFFFTLLFLSPVNYLPYSRPLQAEERIPK